MKILIVDDSVVVRNLLKRVISSIDGVGDISIAANGAKAIEKLLMDPFDLMILDMEMPEMDGIATLRAMQAKKIKTKCMIFASATGTGASTAMEALRLGACDVISKPVFDSFSPDQLVESIHRLFDSKIRLLIKAPPSSMADALRAMNLVQKTISAAPRRTAPKTDIRTFRPEVLVVASSTGGPAALEGILSRIEGPLSIPVLIAQHMPAGFTKSLADRLGLIAGMPAGEGKHGEIIEAGRIYLAPGDYHMTIERRAKGVAIVLDQSPPILHVRPAANKLMDSVAQVYGNRTLGMVLTGMGEDGKDGAMAIKSAGGMVLIQNQESCVVWGMPGAVAVAGAFDHEGDLVALAGWIRSCGKESA